MCQSRGDSGILYSRSDELGNRSRHGAQAEGSRPATATSAPLSSGKTRTEWWDPPLPVTTGPRRAPQFANGSLAARVPAPLRPRGRSFLHPPTAPRSLAPVRCRRNTATTTPLWSARCCLPRRTRQKH